MELQLFEAHKLQSAPCGCSYDDACQLPAGIGRRTYTAASRLAQVPCSQRIASARTDRASRDPAAEGFKKHCNVFQTVTTLQLKRRLRKMSRLLTLRRCGRWHAERS